MITAVFLWSAALAAPETTPLDNGVRVVVDARTDAPGLVTVGWFSGVGSAHTAPGATAAALAAQAHGTHSVANGQVAHTWIETVGDLPTVHLCTDDAGATLTTSVDGLAGWAWLASDALADPVIHDVSATSWPVDVDVLRGQQRRLRDPRHLVVVVAGDVTLDAVVQAIGPAFRRLPSVAIDTVTPPVTNTTDRVVIEQTRGGPTTLSMRVPAAQATRQVVRELDAAVASALDGVAYDATLTLDDAGPTWTATLTATPSPGGSRSIEPAWQRFVLGVQGSDTAPPAPTHSPPTLVQLAHDALRSEPLPEGQRNDVLTALSDPHRTVVLGVGLPDDPVLDAIRRAHGEMAAELVRLRLRTVSSTASGELPRLIRTLEAERARMPSALRPAMDPVLSAARERLP